MKNKFCVLGINICIFAARKMVIVVQLVRTPDCGSGGRGFESHLSPGNEGLALQGLFFIIKN